METHLAEAVVVVCETCRPDSTDKLVLGLAEAITAAGLGGSVAIMRQACLNVCDSPFAIAIQGPGRATYVFGDVALPDDTADVIAVLRLYLESQAGWIEDARGCGRLRDCLKSRVRALPERPPLA